MHGRIVSKVIDCPACGGGGRAKNHACHRCKGLGKIFAQVWESEEDAETKKESSHHEKARPAGCGRG